MKKTIFAIALACAALPGTGDILTAQTAPKAIPNQHDMAQDRISYLENGALKIGVNLDLGGAITYLSLAGGENLINSHDWGRQIQMSFYSGPNPFAPNGKQPHPHWAGLGWNPIQSGDVAGKRSRVVEQRVEQRNDGRELYVKCIPMQWPLDNEPGECTFETWIRLDGKTAQVRSRLVNARSDKTQYHGRDQELPAVYTNGPYWRLMTYSGAKPFSGAALSQIPAKMPWTKWQATENWAALVNDKEFGLGIFTPGAQQYLGGFAGKPGAGGPKDGPTGYISPLHREVLDHNIVYDYSYTLIVGDLKEIRDYVYKNAPRPKLPNYRFASDRQHWIYRNATDAGWPIKDEIKILLDGNDPHLEGPLELWQAEGAPKLYIEGAWQTSQKTAEVFWTRFDGQTPAQNSVRFEVIPDGQFRVYEVDLSASPNYKGAISRLRLDPVFSGKTGEFVRLRAVGFVKPTP